MAAAGRALIECRQAMAAAGTSPSAEALQGAAPVYEWRHYPAGDIHDPASHAQYFYHAHPPGERRPAAGKSMVTSTPSCARAACPRACARWCCRNSPSPITRRRRKRRSSPRRPKRQRRGSRSLEPSRCRRDGRDRCAAALLHHQPLGDRRDLVSRRRCRADARPLRVRRRRTVAAAQSLDRRAARRSTSRSSPISSPGATPR